MSNLIKMKSANDLHDIIVDFLEKSEEIHDVQDYFATSIITDKKG